MILGAADILEGSVCSVCGGDDDRPYRSVLLGSAEQLCWLCFEDWYEGGITDRAELKRNRTLEDK